MSITLKTKTKIEKWQGKESEQQTREIVERVEKSKSNILLHEGKDFRSQRDLVFQPVLPFSRMFTLIRPT